MPQKLGAADVRKIAQLAHLALTPDEVDRFTRQLTDILAHCEEIQRVDTTGVPPTSHALAAGPGWRDDELVPSLGRDAALAGAPDASRSAGLFKVPKVL